MKDIKISAITVTKNRCNFLKKAIEYYIKQTHPNKEMLIMYYSDDEETVNYLKGLDKEWRSNHSIRIFKHIPQEGIYLGALRNHLIEHATGDYLVIWDDDDYYAPERMEVQLDYILRDNLVACTLNSLLLYSKKRDEVKLSFERLEGWEGSLMCKIDKMPLYRNLERYEDTPVLEHIFMYEHAKAIFYPDLYVYFLHDSNISTSFHKEELFFNSRELNGKRNYEIKKLIGVYK